MFLISYIIRIPGSGLFQQFVLVRDLLPRVSGLGVYTECDVIQLSCRGWWGLLINLRPVSRSRDNSGPIRGHLGSGSGCVLRLRSWDWLLLTQASGTQFVQQQQSLTTESEATFWNAVCAVCFHSISYVLFLLINTILVQLKLYTFVYVIFVSFHNR